MGLSVPPATFCSSLPRPEILDRAAAKQRLSTLSPETEEHAQLSGALMKVAGIVEICLSNHTYKICTQQGRLLGGFGSSEHFFIGEAVELGELEGKTLLNRGDVSVSFGHIIALAGDFYGIPNRPISLLGGSDQEKERRFMDAFATLENANPEQIRRLITEIEGEYHEVRNSAAPHHCYSSRLIGSNNRFKEIKGDIDELLVDNSDHFSGNAREAYFIGHSLACREAALAGQSQDKERLKKAYALEAFACHFLTDLFAAGHIRNCRGPLEDFLRETLKFSPECSKALSGVLTGAQHEYDGERGLEVFIEEEPETLWRAYGDGFFFTPKNKMNQDRAIRTVQQSIGEVAEAYKERSVSPTQMMGRIPKAHKFNHEPLYLIREDGRLVIFPDGDEKLIQSKEEYLLEAIPLALSVLPESYINGFIDGYIFPFHMELPSKLQNIRDTLSKIVTPRIERLTGKLWHVVGIASFAQVKAIAERDAALTQELMDTAKATYEQGQQILGAVNQLAKRIEDLHLRFEMAPVRSAVENIQESFHQLSYNLDLEELSQMKHRFRDSAIKIMNIFLNVQENAELFSNRSLLIAYAEIQFPNQSLEEKKLGATRWFRQILQYQIAAFSTYLNLKYRERGDPVKAMEDIRTFQNDLVKQLNANRESIIPDVFYASNAYADVRQQAIEQQNAFLDFVEHS